MTPLRRRTTRSKSKPQPDPEAKFREYEETFKKGTVLEVSSDDPGLRGSWYSATVIRTISRTSRKIFVEYHNLVADDEGTKQLREFVDAVLVRPIPPLDPNRKYMVMEDVDAYHNDGWWEGVVTQVNEDAVGGSRKCRYSVFFRCSREQIDFFPKDLRLHREWVCADQWVPPADFDLNHLSPHGQKRKNGDDRDEGSNGDHSAGGNERSMRNGGGREAVRRSGASPSKQCGSGGCGGVVMANGGRYGNRSSTGLISNGGEARKKQRISTSNVVRSNDEVNRNGTLKDPRSRSSSRAGRVVSSN